MIEIEIEILTLKKIGIADKEHYLNKVGFVNFFNQGKEVFQRQA